MELILNEKSFMFSKVPINVVIKDLTNVFAGKNNRSLLHTISQSKYIKFKNYISKKYSNYLNDDLGSFLLKLKREKNSDYKIFLNANGDSVYCEFNIDAKYAENKGLYLYTLNKVIVYIGRSRDPFKKRINSGYGRISPKNCYIDGQSTNCHLNSLVNKNINDVSLYLCPLLGDNEIIESERDLISTLNPLWNISLKKRVS